MGMANYGLYFSFEVIEVFIYRTALQSGDGTLTRWGMQPTRCVVCACSYSLKIVQAFLRERSSTGRVGERKVDKSSGLGESFLVNAVQTGKSQSQVLFLLLFRFAPFTGCCPLV